MQNPSGMRLIDTDGILSIGNVEPNTGTIQMQGGNKVNMVNPSAVLVKGGEDGATLKGQAGFVGTNTGSDQNRKKAGLFEKFRSLPADVLMRAGAATMGASNLPSALGAAGDVYGDYFATQSPEAKLDRALDLYSRINNINKINAKVNQDVKENNELIGNLSSVANQFRAASEMLNANPSAVGLGFNTILRDISGVDLAGFTDNPEAGIRSQLQTLKISETLLNTAKTKGAISNAEMQIFMSDQPKFSYSNAQWQRWLTRRQEAINNILRRLNSGEVVELAKQPSAEEIQKLGQMENSWIDSLSQGLLSGQSDSVSQGNADMEAADAIIN